MGKVWSLRMCRKEGGDETMEKEETSSWRLSRRRDCYKAARQEF